MQLLTFFSLLVISLGCPGIQKVQSNSNEFNGTWIPIRQEMGGKHSQPPFSKNKS